MGLDEEVISWLSKEDKKAKRRKEPEISEIYSIIQDAQALNLPPSSLFSMHRWDRRLLHYYLLVRWYREEKSMQKMKEKEPVELPKVSEIPKTESIGRKKG